MKLKSVLKLFLSGCIFGIFVFILAPVNSVSAASNVGGPCKTNSDCDQSNILICDRGSLTCIFDDGSGGIPGPSSNLTTCSATVSCPSGQTCYNGACVANPSGGSNPCAGVSCIPGCTCSNTNGGICVLSSDSTKACTSTSGGVTPPDSPSAPATPAAPTTASCPAGTSQGTCPTDLCYVNGLCLPKSQFQNGIAGSPTLVALLLSIIKILLSFAGIVAVVMLVLGGYWYMASGGNEEVAEKGKKTIFNFVLGLVLIIMAYAIVTIISSTLTSNVDTLIQTK